MLSGCFHLFIQWAFFVKHSLIYAKYKRILLRDPLQSWVFFLIQSNLKRCSNNVSIFLVCKWRWQRLFCDLNALCALLHLYRVQRTFFGSVCPLGVQDGIWRPLIHYKQYFDRKCSSLYYTENKTASWTPRGQTDPNKTI